jgi:hypothetical protein
MPNPAAIKRIVSSSGAPRTAAHLKINAIDYASLPRGQCPPLRTSLARLPVFFGNWKYAQATASDSRKVAFAFDHRRREHLTSAVAVSSCSAKRFARPE